MQGLENSEKDDSIGLKPLGKITLRKALRDC